MESLATKPCEEFEIAAYIDGDLSSIQEFEMEKHFKVCTACSKELAEQKRLLRAMDFAFTSPESSFEIPKDFAATIVTRAESNVNGLRCPIERKRALTYCVLLISIAIIGIGESRFRVLDLIQRLADNVFSIISFAGHFIYDAAAGIGSIFSGISERLFLFSDSSTVLLFLIFILALIAFSRLLIRYHRA
jgi:predicted anti-sigma-YlaC factor YlaD